MTYYIEYEQSGNPYTFTSCTAQDCDKHNCSRHKSHYTEQSTANLYLECDDYIREENNS